MRYFLFAFLSPLFLFAQNNTQVIRGRITDKFSQMPLQGASVELLPGEVKSLTDSLGQFMFSNLKPDRYDLRISKEGYKTTSLSNVLLTSGKEIVLDIGLEEQILQTRAVLVKPKQIGAMNKLATVSTRSFAMEDVNRYAGGRSDPARLAANFAGVSAPDDSRNDLVIRGNSPVGVLWRIDGMAVTNPNHFASVGTTGGSVSALNTNLLKSADFFTSAFPSEYGNAVAGVFDLSLREGNAQKRETTLQAGVITGLELTTEGPFSKKSSASYLIGYRYSLAGIAQALGVDIGTTATPSYQDLSFKLSSGTTKFGKFSVFGILATSTINIGGGSANTLYGNGNQLDFASKIGIGGLQHTKQVNSKSYFLTTIGVNAAENAQTSYDIDHVIDSSFVRETSTALKNTYYIQTSYHLKVNARMFLKVGVQDELIATNLYYQTKNNAIAPAHTVWDYDSSTNLAQAFLHLKYQLTDQLTVNTGLHAQYFALNKAQALEPRLGINYTINAKHSLQFGYGLHAQMQPINVYYLQQIDPFNNVSYHNINLDFTKSHHLVLGYQWQAAAAWRLKTEVYYQSLYNVPIQAISSSYSMLNTGATFKTDLTDSLVNGGTGQNYGLELTLEKLFSKGFYGLFTSTLYESNYVASDGVKRNTSFNGRYVVNILAGKEWKIGTGSQNRFAVDVKFTNAGGRAYTPIDLASSIAQDREVLVTDVNSAYYNTYYRLDLKAGLTINSPKRKLAQTLSLDLQNVTNHKNIFTESYDRQNQSIRYTYQLGFFPNVVYKLQF